VLSSEPKMNIICCQSISHLINHSMQLQKSTYLLGSTRHYRTRLCVAEFTQHTVNDIHSIEKIDDCKMHIHTPQLANIQFTDFKAVLEFRNMVYYATIHYTMRSCVSVGNQSSIPANQNAFVKCDGVKNIKLKLFHHLIASS